jgi:hypothetical protein
MSVVCSVASKKACKNRVICFRKNNQVGVAVNKKDKKNSNLTATIDHVLWIINGETD